MLSTSSKRRLALLTSHTRNRLQNRYVSAAAKKEEVVFAKKSDSSFRYKHSVPIALASLSVGFLAGRESRKDPSQEELVIPNGLPRTCCETPELTEKQKDLFKTLKRIVGRANVLDGTVEDTKTSQFLKGARLGRGTALYIVRPKKLRELIEIVRETVEADCVVLVQGQNTGLTGGSVPRRQDDNRPTVVVSMKDLDTIIPIDDGKRVVCLGGVGLASLQNYTKSSFGRESHSTLGSTFLNPTTAAGVSLGSGGTQCRKGPAYTDRALYLKVDKDKFGRPVVKIVNTLGVNGLDKEEGEFEAHIRHDGLIRLMDAYVEKVKGGFENTMKKSNDTFGKAAASDVEYKKRLCNHNKQVSRFNADTSGCECNRSEGKVMVLASVHDTFEPPKTSKTFWVSFDSLDTALKFRKEVCLDNPDDVPVSVEYMDRDSYDVIDRAGRVLGNMIKLVGPSSAIIRDLWNVKLWIEALDFAGAPLWIDKLLYFVNPMLPSLLPSPISTLGKQKDHHVAMTVGDFEGSLDRVTNRLAAFSKKHGDKVTLYECKKESDLASITAFRFVAAPAFRTWCVGEGVQGISVDYALPRNGGHAPLLSSASVLKRMRYSHFGCNVVHEDVAFSPGVDVHSAKMELKQSVEHKCGGKLPAEHGHGTEYVAPAETQRRWKKMDPLNVMNPGIGGLSSRHAYKE
eukprot:scaffold6638_cov127-Cylindrotheca_fusiformis.AAC.7